MAASGRPLVDAALALARLETGAGSPSAEAGSSACRAVRRDRDPDHPSRDRPWPTAAQRRSIRWAQ